MTHDQRVRRFNSEVWPYLPVVLRVARLLTHNHAEAEDLAQETLLRAFGSLERFQQGTNLRAWLLTILRNLRTDRVRAAAARPAGSLDAMDDIASDQPEPQRDWHDPRSMLEALSDQQMIDALSTLPEEIRWTLLLVDVEGLDLQTAAEVLDVPLGTVKSRAHRGRRMLREKLLPLARQMRLEV